MDSTKQILDTVRSFLDSPTEPSPFVLASKKFNYSISNEVNEDPHCKSFHVSDIDQAKSILNP